VSAAAHTLGGLSPAACAVAAAVFIELRLKTIGVGANREASIAGVDFGAGSRRTGAAPVRRSGAPPPNF
jgi:hypothetical protein